jgi:hypothetical protein
MTWRCPSASHGASVSIDELLLFILALEEKYVEVTNANVGSLSQLCDEFGFESTCAYFGVIQ